MWAAGTAPSRRSGTYIYIKLHDHPHARCFISNTTAIQAGTATTEKYQGADWYKKWKNDLPNYYITEEEAYAAGWIPSKGNLGLVAPGKMLAKGIYRNDDGHLPTAPGRIWYEADINYHGGYRNGCRLLYSSNGLLFTTYNHYYNFCEIV